MIDGVCFDGMLIDEMVVIVAEEAKEVLHADLSLNLVLSMPGTSWAPSSGIDKTYMAMGMAYRTHAVPTVCKRGQASAPHGSGRPDTDKHIEEVDPCSCEELASATPHANNTLDPSGR
jgi:hypothetical protein